MIERTVGCIISRYIVKDTASQLNLIDTYAHRPEEPKMD
jgi:hypothetical protein